MGKKKTRVSISLLLLFILSIFVLSNGIFENYNISTDENSLDNENLKSSKIWGKITVNNDNWAGLDPSILSGAGTYSDPWVIKDLEIDCGGSGNGILIQNSNDYFIIRNCTVYNSGGGLVDAGIKLLSASNGTLINNNVSDNHFGIFLQISDNNTISGNSAINNERGIYLYDSDNSIISRNNASNNSFYGIYLGFSSNNNIISGNTGSKNTMVGIVIDNSYNNNVSGNTVTNNDRGIYLYSGSYNTVSGNTATNNNEYGIYLRFSDNNTISGNVIANNIDTGLGVGDTSNSNNNSIYNNVFLDNSLHAEDFGSDNQWNSYLVGNYWDNYTDPIIGGVDANDDGIGDVNYTISGTAKTNDTKPIFENPIYNGSTIQIDGDADWNRTALVKWWCSGSGTYSDPYIIEDLIIDGQNSSSCILIESTNDYFILRNNTVYNSSSGNYDAGISLAFVVNGQLENNNCSNNNRFGIRLSQSQNITISENIAHNNSYHGILLVSSHNNTLSGNTLNENAHGVQLTNSNNNIISENSAFNNGVGEGIYLTNGATNNAIINNNLTYNKRGIMVVGSHNNTLIGNDAHHNDYGIYLFRSNYTTITGNKLSYNDLIGLYLSGSNNSDVIENTFIGNSYKNVDEQPDNVNNYFFWNYWDDYTGVDLNDDGIGDTPYLISVTTGSQDNYPQWWDGDDIRYWNLVGTISIHGNAGWASLAASEKWCSGSGTSTDPYILENVFVNASGEDGCIRVSSSDVHFIIRNTTLANNNTYISAGIMLSGVTNGIIQNNTLYNHYWGIFVGSSNDITVLENTVRDSNSSGIVVIGSNNSIVQDNTLFNNMIEIYIQNGIKLQNSNNITVFENTATNNFVGIDLYNSNNSIVRNNMMSDNNNGITLHNSNNNTVLENTAVYNNGGISISALSDNNLILRNNISFNRGSGVSVYSTGANNAFKSNQIVNNNYGVFLHDSNCTGNIFSNNSFIGNDINAKDEGVNNFWDNGTLGNYWDDYSGNDKNDDGIGDIPYNITGSAGSVDNYPIWEDGEDGEEVSEFPLIVIIIASTSIAGGIGVAGITIFLLRKRSQLRVSN